MVQCRCSRPPQRGALLLILWLLALSRVAPALDAPWTPDGNPPLLVDLVQSTPAETQREVTPPAMPAWTGGGQGDGGTLFAGYLPEAPPSLSDAVDSYQSALPQPFAERSDFAGRDGTQDDARPRERKQGLRLRQRRKEQENSQLSKTSATDTASARPRRGELRTRRRRKPDLATTERRGTRSEVMDDFRHNPDRNDDAYIPFLGTVNREEAEAARPEAEPEQELGEGVAVARVDAAERNPEEARPAVDKYADVAARDPEPKSEPEPEAAPAPRHEPPPPPPMTREPRVADLEPWRQQRAAPRPTRAEVEDYRQRLEMRLLERYNNLPRFAGSVGKVAVVLSKPLDESLDGSLIRAEFDQLVYDPWGKRIPELEQEYYVVTFGSGGARQVRSDPSIRVGLDMEKTYSEQAPLNADPFRNVPDRRVFRSAPPAPANGATPAARMPDWWRPEFPELNQ